MDEKTWRSTTTDRVWMLEHVREKAPPRKLRLVGCACCWRLGVLLPEVCRDAVEVAELFADGKADQSELLRASGMVSQAMTRLAESGFSGAAFRACLHTTDPDPWVAAHAATWALSAVGAGYWREELTAQCELARCVLGNPFRPATAGPWRESVAVGQIVRVIADEGRFSDLPILADALEDAGCDDEDILKHCRGGGPHGRGCWVIDLVLGEE